MSPPKNTIVLHYSLFMMSENHQNHTRMIFLHKLETELLFYQCTMCYELVVLFSRICTWVQGKRGVSRKIAMEKINNSLQNKIRRIATYILLHICIVPSKPLSIVKFLTLNVNFFLLNKQEPQILTSCFNTAFDIYLIAL